MTGPLSAAELASIRALHNSWLNQLCTITRPDGGKTSDGFPDASPTTIATGVACRAEPASSAGGTERVAGAGVVRADEWRVHLPSSVAAVQARDTIVVAGVGAFTVTSSTSGRGVNTDVVARCVRVDP